MSLKGERADDIAALIYKIKELGTKKFKYKETESWISKSKDNEEYLKRNK